MGQRLADLEPATGWPAKGADSLRRQTSLMKNLISRIEATLEKHGMLRAGEEVLVACSGGPDSVALFYLLRELAPRLGIRLSVVHFDHALRPSSSKDLAFVRRLALKAGVPFYGGRNSAKKERKGLSPEEAAREWRYEFFEKTARKAGIRKIALAHQGDDQAETVLMRILQGTGLRGLQGIRPVMKKGSLILIRPLAEIRREELLRFLKSRSLPYRKDRTNRSPRFLRNRIRHRLLPLLEKEFTPRIREVLCRLAETTAKESGGLDLWVRERKGEFLRARRNGALNVRRSEFLRLPGPLQFRLLDEFLKLLHPGSGLNFEAWGRIERGLARGRFRISLPRNLDLQLTPKKFTLRKQAL